MIRSMPRAVVAEMVARNATVSRSDMSRRPRAEPEPPTGIGPPAEPGPPVDGGEWSAPELGAPPLLCLDTVHHRPGPARGEPFELGSLDAWPPIAINVDAIETIG